MCWSWAHCNRDWFGLPKSIGLDCIDCDFLVKRVCGIVTLVLSVFIVTVSLSAPSLHDCARSRYWNVIGQNDGSTDTGSHGPGSSDDNRNTATKTLYTLQHLRTVASKGSQSGSITFGKNPTCERGTHMSELLKQVRASHACFFKPEPNFRILLLGIMMIVSPMQLTVPSLVPIQISFSVNPHQLSERSETIVCSLEENWWTILECLFPDGDDECVFIIPSLEARSQILSIKDRRNGIGILVFELGSLGRTFLIWVFLVFLLKGFLSSWQASCMLTTLSFACLPPGGSRRLSLVFRFDVF